MSFIIDILNEYELENEFETLADDNIKQQLRPILDNFGSYTLKKDDYCKFVRLVSKVKSENFKMLIPQMMEDFDLTSSLEKWEKVNPDYLEWEYEDHIGFLVWRAITKGKLLNGSGLGLDNYEIITNNVCSIIHYLFAHYANSFTFEQIFILTCAIDLLVFLKDDLSLNDIIFSLHEIFVNNYILLDDEVFSLDKEYLIIPDFLSQ